MGFSVQYYDSAKKKAYTSKILAVYSIAVSIILIIHYKTSDVLSSSSSQEQSMVALAVGGIEATLLVNIMLLGTIRRYIARRNSEELFNDFIGVHKAVGYSAEYLYKDMNKKALKAIIIGFSLIVFLTSKKTSEILHRYNSLHIDAELKQTVEIFLIQLMHHPIKFTAFGMFTLDYSILFSIITSTTSYLIILIQFELADNCKKD
ncbi:putative gustatory receptor 28a [Armigeres subalbatus]|uniref:putative gustatory receptor 28a n=1 Tax=Armigeres subalbatus TaxID=124917 RepID=UPI002ED07A5C